MRRTGVGLQGEWPVDVILSHKAGVHLTGSENATTEISFKMFYYSSVYMGGCTMINFENTLPAQCVESPKLQKCHIYPWTKGGADGRSWIETH